MKSLDRSVEGVKKRRGGRRLLRRRGWNLKWFLRVDPVIQFILREERGGEMIKEMDEEGK